MTASPKAEPNQAGSAPRPPGRPREADPERQRGLILDAASAQFARRGFDGASLREIAAGAKLSHAVIRHYFGSKADLWEATADYLFGLMAQAVVEAMRHVDMADPAARLRAQVRASVRTAARIPHLAGFTMQAGLAGGARYERLVDRHLRPAYTFSLEPFHKLKAAGQVVPIEPHFAFLIVTNAAIGPFAQSANSRALAGMDLSEPAIADAYADTLIAVLSHGVLGAPDRPQAPEA